MAKSNARQLGMLFARLQIALPGGRSYLLAPARSDRRTMGVAQAFVAVIEAAGYPVRVVELATLPHAVAAGGGELRESPAERIRNAVQGPGYVVAHGGGLLDDPAVALAVPAVDGIVVLAQCGKTARADLERARLEIERASGRLAGAVLLT